MGYTVVSVSILEIQMETFCFSSLLLGNSCNYANSSSNYYVIMIVQNLKQFRN